MANARQLYGCNFEIFGKVQGVSFRKYTEKQSKQLGIRGWVMNTKHGTVQGELEGTGEQLQQMKSWLQTKGSPESHIEKTSFSDLRQISKYHFDNFSIRE
ncbi:uncharacterized protein Dwil_GK12388 [Drosophila willistoni]|uniref:Acylphosphatase n=1 Tax=Drosophila willistoni TaxID=7260 RepID=B4N4L3_DROWI|nr:acylphosphatase-2 [Drosophila willistoni]EDW79087.1 uncharacterized protein Dwil_GK12388 [Drosophila willistoni]